MVPLKIKQILVPAFRSVEEVLKSNRKSDVVMESILAGATLSLMIGILMLNLKLPTKGALYLTIQRRTLKFVS